MRPSAMHRQGGFRLLGFSPLFWLAILAIAGIVAALAIPSDALFVPRRKVAEVEAAAEACRTRVAGFVADRKRLPRDAAEAGCDRPASRHAAGIDVSGGMVKVALHAVDPALDGRFLAYQALDAGGRPADGTQPVARWRCTTDADLQHAIAAALPPDCRQPPV